jgi:hypothetical protein
MKKNKLYILLSFLTLAILFATSALCTQCGQSGETPTLQLKIVKGPDFSEPDNICLYQIEAIVTGTPDPEIEFATGDNVSLLSPDLVEVSVDMGGSYILTATATNDSGTATASVTLSGQCGEEAREEEVTEEEAAEETPGQNEKAQENHDPVINGFIYPPDPYGQWDYDFTVQAEDPDGDTLEYNWEVNTTIGSPPEYNPSEPKMHWITPNVPGDYTVTVIVTDGRGGEATSSLTITINYIAHFKSMPVVVSEGGYAVYGGATEDGSYIYAGDSFDNKFCLGFVSFDITELKGGIIYNATFTLNNKQVYGDPSFFQPLYANALYWGKRPINQSDLTSQGIRLPNIKGYPEPSNSTSDWLAYDPSQLLQNAISAGQDRFQVRIQFTGNITDNDGEADGWRFEQQNAVLEVIVLEQN